ncbi:hypothetical protein N7523_001124 [Penicillium sp. IBT 18751x]|nr:hypothetical protein N7523_001124 [Penicillium sp. IBT 18751x]
MSGRNLCVRILLPILQLVPQTRLCTAFECPEIMAGLFPYQYPNNLAGFGCRTYCVSPKLYLLL